MSIKPSEKEGIGYVESGIWFHYHGALEPLRKLGYRVWMNLFEKQLVLMKAVEVYGADRVVEMLYEASLRNRERPRVRAILEADMRWVAERYLKFK